MFKDDVIDVEELGELVSFIGYELTEEFKNMSPEDQKTKGWGDEEDTQEDGNKEAPKPEGGEEQPKEEEKTAPAAAPEEQPKEDDEDDNEEEKAKQLFGLDK